MARSTPDQPTAGAWDAFCQRFEFFFMEGQYLANEKVEAQRKSGSWYERYRHIVAFLVPLVVVHGLYWPYMIVNDKLHVFTDHSKASDIPNWYMTLTMVFGSFIAGSTSEGGAAVAFPVLTLLFKVKAGIARDFSFMTQSFGMTAAAFTILMMQIRVEWYSIFYTTLGGVPGLIFGIEYVFPRMPSPYPKMVFVSTWLSFAFALYLVNRIHGRKVYPHVPYWDRGVIAKLGPITINWKALVLVAAGFLGGLCSAIGGSGIDIASFATLTLLFRVSEKVATPTSVVLMAVNTVIGFIYRENIQHQVHPAAWDFLYVVIPVVSTFGPLGALLSSYFHRLVHATVVYVMDIAQFIGAMVLVQPWTHHKTNNPTKLSLTIFGLVVGGAFLFQSLASLGERLMQAQEALTLNTKNGVDLEHGTPGPEDECKNSSSIHPLSTHGIQST